MYPVGFIVTHADKVNSYLDCFHLTGEIVNQTEFSGSTVPCGGISWWTSLTLTRPLCQVDGLKCRVFSSYSRWGNKSHNGELWVLVS